MRTRFRAFTLAVGLLLSGLVSPAVDAGKGGSSGRSFSSGRGSASSFSRPSSSSTGRSSTSSSSSPRGKSYSAPAPSRTSSSTSKSYTPSSRPASTPSLKPNPSAGSKPSGPSFDRGAGLAQQKAESKSAFLAKSTPVPSTNGHPSPPSVPKSSAAPSGKRYSGSGDSTPTSSASTRPAGKSYDPVAAQSQRKEESRRAFVKGKEPQSTYTDVGGNTQPIDPRARTTQVLREEVDRDRWATRDWRARRVFGDYSSRPVVVYHDPYSNWFWWWLLSRDLDTRANWAYHHRSTMDESRYRDLQAHDAQLEARLKQLEAQGVPRDPEYHPSDIDRDLMYSDQYIQAVYNPVPVRRAPTAAPGWVLLKIALIIALLVFLVWLVFIKRWGGTPGPDNASLGPSSSNREKG